jgi:triacylglycerol lipase
VQSERLIDPQLLSILNQMPSLETSAEILPGMREAMSAWKLTAPEAMDVLREEQLIEASDGRRIRILVYTPTLTAPTGGLLWIHGGGMVMGTPEINDAPNRYLAQQAGCVIVAIAYRLAPEEPYPAALDDCYEVLQWMHRQAAVLRRCCRRKRRWSPVRSIGPARARSWGRSDFRTVSDVPYAR